MGVGRDDGTREILFMAFVVIGERCGRFFAISLSLSLVEDNR